MALDTASFELVLAAVQRCVKERRVSAENYLQEHDEVPADIIEDMKAMGLFGLTVPYLHRVSADCSPRISTLKVH
jgi:acyl-CoA dehydrogenase